MAKGRKRAPAKSPLPKLPANGYKNIRKCGNSFQGYTPNKTNFTKTKPTARAAAAALANREFTAGSAANRGTSDTPHTPIGALLFPSPPRACPPLTFCAACISLAPQCVDSSPWTPERPPTRA